MDKNSPAIQAISAVFVAIFTAVLISFTHRQAQIAADNKDVLKAIERAWIILNDPQLADVPASPDENRLTLVTVRYSFGNTGKSPAWLRQTSVNFSKVKKNGLPEHPTYRNIHAFAPAVAVNPNCFHPATGIINRLEDDHLSPEDIGRIKAGDDIIVLYGYVEYTDIFNDWHITRYCLVWHQATQADPYTGWRFGGPPAYTEQT